jgi:maltoporin
MHFHARRSLGLIVPLGLAAALQAQSPSATEVEGIRREIDQLRRDYERRMEQLEQQLKRLEQAASLPPSSAPAVEPAPAVAVISPAAFAATHAAAARAAADSRELSDALKVNEYVNSEFQLDQQTRQWSIVGTTNGPVKARLEKVLNDFIDFGGYFRAGYGRDSEGGPQVAFQNPGALSKYRLGNEAEDYGELILGKNWYVPGMFSLDRPLRADGTPDGPIARAQLRIAFYNPYSDYNSGTSTQVTLPEAWVGIGNVVASQPEMNFWAGNRFYRRQDIYINDFFYWNVSGGGAGVEDYRLPVGKLAFAWIGNGSQSGLYSDVPAPDPANKAGFSKSTYDIRWYDFQVPGGSGEVGVDVARTASGKDQFGRAAEDSYGAGLTLVHTARRLVDPDSVNRLSVQVGSGPSKTFTSGFQTFGTPDGNFILPEPGDSWRFRITESLVLQPSDLFSIAPVLMYQFTDYAGEFGTQNWVSAGVRPILQFNKFFRLAFEGGVDWVSESGLSPEGNVMKLTLAPELALGDRFFSRPVLRVFATYAHWSDGLLGSVGGLDYGDQNWGLTYGVQAEAWW